MEQMRTVHKKHINTTKLAVLILSAVVVIMTVVIVILVGHNNSYKNNIGGSLSGAQSELSSLQNELSQKSSEAESYSQAIDEQNSAYESEKNDLNNKISELNKQVALKKAREAANAAVAAPGETPPDDSSKTVYLTFDDGPSPNTPQILSILNSYGVKATFFVINTRYNNYMKDIVSSGNTIALHSYTHNYAQIYSSDEAYYQDLQAISDVVYNETGVRSNIMRFPGGSSNKVSAKYSAGIMTRITQGVLDKGYQYFDWNCSSGDAEGNNIAVGTIVSRCKAMPSSNTVIVLMHDTGAKSTTVQALPQIIEYYKSIGCNFGVLTSATHPIHHKILN